METQTETAEDLAYQRGRGTSLGGLRPKCTLLDENGALAIGKFPSVTDEHAVTKAAVLALRLAALAGIDSSAMPMSPVRAHAVGAIASTLVQIRPTFEHPAGLSLGPLPVCWSRNQSCLSRRWGRSSPATQ